MIASLPMYDRPETRAANDRFWAAIRARLGQGPEGLTRGGDSWAVWRAPQLLLAQTCGYPYRACLHPDVTLVGTPDYAVPDCPPGYYNSVIITRIDDPRQTIDEFASGTLAYNDPMSQSGWAALSEHLSAARVYCPIRLQTGSHLASARAVQEGRADLAAIDAVSWVMMRRWDRFTDQLRVLTRTRPHAGLPYITAKGNDPEVLAAAISAAIVELAPQDRATLQITGLVRLPCAVYLDIPNPPDPWFFRIPPENYRLT